MQLRPKPRGSLAESLGEAGGVQDPGGVNSMCKGPAADRSWVTGGEWPRAKGNSHSHVKEPIQSISQSGPLHGLLEKPQQGTLCASVCASAKREYGQHRCHGLVLRILC